MTENHIDADQTVEAETTQAMPEQTAATPATGQVTISKRALGIVAGVLVGFVLLGGVFAAGVAVGGRMGGRAGALAPGGVVAQGQAGFGAEPGNQQGDAFGQRGRGGRGGRGMMPGQQRPGQGQPPQDQQGTLPGAPGTAPVPEGSK